MHGGDRDEMEKRPLDWVRVVCIVDAQYCCGEMLTGRYRCWRKKGSFSVKSQAAEYF